VPIAVVSKSVLAHAELHQTTENTTVNAAIQNLREGLAISMRETACARRAKPRQPSANRPKSVCNRGDRLHSYSFQNCRALSTEQELTPLSALKKISRLGTL